MKTSTAPAHAVALPAQLAGPRSVSGPGVEVRPLERGEVEAVLGVFAGMGARSRELRFLVPKARLTELDLRQLTAVDRHDHVAVLATSARDHQPVGIARFTRDLDDPASADLAVEVVDAWHGRGVATVLLRALAEHALEVGVRRFTALVSRDNVPVLNLLRKTPGVARTGAGLGSLEYAVTLSEVVR
jgi:GNAT superfamily N-acetyltransferase